MLLKLDERTRHLLRYLPRGGWMSWIELALLAVLAVQLARLVWTILTPVTPLGAWTPTQAAIAPIASRGALFRGFDPFFRNLPAQAAAQPGVTSLDLKLFGVRVNEGSGGGSAIISGPDGVQKSIVIGEEIVPGVKLAGVAFDHVLVDRGGTKEILYIDQSKPATAVGANTASPGSGPAIVPPLPVPAPPSQGTTVAPPIITPPPSTPVPHSPPPPPPVGAPSNTDKK